MREAGAGADLVADPNGIWLYVDQPDRSLPERGWKLHVSATPWNAADVLDRCVPVLLAAGATFKVAASAGRVLELNQGAGGTSQVGKFITVYPTDDGDAVGLARSLHEATDGMRGPRVITDRALSPSSLVHYRHAPFVLRAADDGDVRRDEPADRPEDPFVAAGLTPERKARLVGGRYLITANLHRSVRGAIHLAVDAQERKTCVLKRAWRDAALMPDGTDARDRLREEAAILQLLAGDSHFPAVGDLVEDELDLFLVMEHLEGKTFAQIARGLHDEGHPPNDEKVAQWGIELARAVEAIHARGLVHRDLNPVNVIVDDPGRLCLIDFELVQREGTRRDSYGAGTAGYMSPGQAAGDAASFLDDLYALGALLFLAATGEDPPAGVADARAVKSSGASRAPGAVLAEIVAACLSFDPTRVSSAAVLRTDLERVLRG